MLADFEAALVEAKKVEEGAESIRIAADEAEAYAKRSKAKKASSDRGNKSNPNRDW